MDFFGQKGYYSSKSGCIRVKVSVFGKLVVFGEKSLYSGKSGCIGAKVILFGQKWMYSENVVELGQELL